MICKNCGRDIPDNATRCPFCLAKTSFVVSNKPTVSNKSIISNKPKESSLRYCLINSQKFWFRVLYYIPIFLSILTLLSFFVYGIVDPLTIQIGKTYGIFQLSSGFLCWLVWFLIGIVLSVIQFIVSKIFLSHVIIRTECLMKIAKYDDK